MTSTKADPAAIAAATDRLAQALETRVPCAAVRDLIGTDDLPAAYAVQQGLVQRRLDGGVTVVGRKIGATSEAVQNQLGVDQPDFGYLLSDMAGYSPCLPIVADLNCPDIGHPVQVTGSDPYRLDRDHDGTGCD